MSEERPSFSWGKGVLHALVPFGLLIAGAVLLASQGGVRDSEKFGDALGKAGAWMFGLGLLFSYGYQTKQKKYVWIGGVGLILYFAVLIALVVAFRPAPPPRALTSDDRSALIEVGESAAKLLQHPYLHFTLKHPGDGYRPLSEMESKAFSAPFEGDPNLKDTFQAYGYLKEDTSEILIIVLSSDANQESLRGFTKGLSESAQSTGFTKITDDLVWSDEKREARFVAKNPVAFFQARALSLHLGEEKLPYMVAVVSISQDQAQGKLITDSLTP